ncbi:MAG TPA: glycosyltransferase [Pyrinomonadaceae bacterium]|jgi:glycosyltransferase involved in cell wall biosynthesis
MMIIAFIVNGSFESAMGHRARALAACLQTRYDIRISYREGNKITALVRFLSDLLRVRPAVSYVFDMSYSGVLGAWLYKLLSRNRLVIDTGDAIYELARSTGSRGSLGLWLTRWFEKFSLRVADGLVVRGSFHQMLLAESGFRAEVIQDGVNTQQFTPLETNGLRKEYGLDGMLTVGLVGSSVWSERLQMCYGWELVELLRLLKDAPVKGIMIGGGSGISHLKARCKAYGIEDKILFAGYVPFEELPKHLGLMDICLSTQTNDVAGQVRTTGKLPLYLACGRYILASRVGEAALVLDEEMLVDYDGVKDDLYPQKLAARVTSLLQHREKVERSRRNIAVARQSFDYEILADRLAQVIEGQIKK